MLTSLQRYNTGLLGWNPVPLFLNRSLFRQEALSSPVLGSHHPSETWNASAEQRPLWRGGGLCLTSDWSVKGEVAPLFTPACLQRKHSRRSVHTGPQFLFGCQIALRWQVFVHKVKQPACAQHLSNYRVWFLNVKPYFWFYLLHFAFVLKAAGVLTVRAPKAASSNRLTSAWVSRIANHFPFPVGLNVSSKQGSQK